MGRRSNNKQYQRKRRIHHYFRVSVMTVVGLFLMLAGLHFGNYYLLEYNNPLRQYSEDELVLDQVTLQNGEKVKVDLITPNEYSRPQTKVQRVNSIVIHYVGNPGTTAQNNRDYFDSLATRKDRYASSHFVVGLKGEVVQCIPLNEESYASNHRNKDTISIEVCHPDETGKFNKATYNSVVALTAYLCEMFQLDQKDVIRHYDVTGKECPKYYVKHQDAWDELVKDVKKGLKSMESQEADGRENNKDKEKS